MYFPIQYIFITSPFDALGRIGGILSRSTSHIVQCNLRVYLRWKCAGNLYFQRKRRKLKENKCMIPLTDLCVNHLHVSSPLYLTSIWREIISHYLARRRKYEIAIFFHYRSVDGNNSFVIEYRFTIWWTVSAANLFSSRYKYSIHKSNAEYSVQRS